MRDIKDIMDIKQAIGQRRHRENKLNELKSKMGIR